MFFEKKSFDIYRSEVCHDLKRDTDVPFIKRVDKEQWIITLWNKKLFPEALYLLALIDYLSKEHNISLNTKYDYYRNCKLKSPLFPVSILLLDSIMPEKHYKERELKLCQKSSLSQEFLKYNIIERNIRDVE